MSAHELMVKTNHHLIKGGTLTDAQKVHIVHQLLAARSTPEQARRFYVGVKFPNNADSNGRRMYPIFYIPPYNDGKKLKNIYHQTPKTHIFSANMYELEILRLLILLAPENPAVQEMMAKTLERLKTTCFGNEDDGVGECFDTSLVVLRFLATAAPEDNAWMQNRMDNYNRHAADKKRPSFSLWYYWLCLSDLPFELAAPEIEKYEPQMLPWLTTKSCVMNSERDKTVHPVIICSLRNCLCRLPEYAHIKDIQPYVSEKDGRLHFDMGGGITQ
ncbi:MAG: hypothetical protein LBN05_00270 [Oscillospiraceae bacterium]|jgi:hypothetical protein|nr:hypothetical protein [Oscillospiraceae bacterium]